MASPIQGEKGQEQPPQSGTLPLAIPIDVPEETDRGNTKDGANIAGSDGEETKGDGGGGFSAYIVSYG